MAHTSDAKIHSRVMSVVDYNLDDLDDKHFQELVQWLVIRILGNGFNFPEPGPDGGRDGYFTGTVNYGGSEWNGYHVVQAKFRQRTGDPGRKCDSNWADGNLKAELELFFGPQAKRLKKPDYYYFVSNVRLSSAGESGGLDKLEALLETYKQDGHLKGYAVWSYKKLCMLLADHADIRTKFGLSAPFERRRPSGESSLIQQQSAESEFGKLINVPHLPPHFVPRPDELAPIKESVLHDSQKAAGITAAPGAQPLAVAQGRNVGLHGMSGIGKTVLATALAHDEDIRRAFPDGVIWVTLGLTPVLTSLQRQVARILGDTTGVFDTPQQGRARLSELLSERACLLILDDVWEFAHADAFAVVGPHGGLLLTTRNAGIPANLGAHEHRLDVLDPDKAVKFLAQWVGDPTSLPRTAWEVAKECGGLPLALALCGAMVRDGRAGWDDLLAALREADLNFIRQDKDAASYQHESLYKAIKVSVDRLSSEDARRFQELAVFPPDEPVPESAVLTLWCRSGRLKEREARELIGLLGRRSIATVKGEGRTRHLLLHDLVHDYATQTAGDLSALHKELIATYRQQCLPVSEKDTVHSPMLKTDWSKGPNDGYFFQRLPWHLLRANETKESEALLTDFSWLQAKLEATDVGMLIADFEHADHAEADSDKASDGGKLALVRGAIRLCASALSDDKTQLAGQLLGRLSNEPSEEIRRLLEAATVWRGAVWLRPINGVLHPPGTALLLTLEGHSDEVTAVALSWDGRCRRIVSGSRDRTVKVWDLESGRQLHTLKGHSDAVTCVTVTPNGRLIVSGSEDHTLRVWDMESTQEVRTLPGHSAEVNGVAVTPDGRRVVSASSDRTLKIWDLESGRELRTLNGHNGEVKAVAVCLDGRRVVSGAFDQMLKVWDLDSGLELRTLPGHKDKVTGVAVTQDGRVVSSSYDQTLKVWDLDGGREPRNLKAHTGKVMAVAVSQVGLRAVSVCGGKLKMWNLESGRQMRTIKGHSGVILGVVLTPDGRRAVSASDDQTLKVWDLEGGKVPETPKGHHGGRVSAVVVSPDGRHAVSASSDRTLRIWDLESGRALRALKEDNGRVTAAAVSPDGLCVVSAASDQVIKVWNLESGEVLRTLPGQAGKIMALVVSPDRWRGVSALHDQTLKVWDLESGQVLCTLNGHSDRVTAVALSRDARRAVSASSDRTLKVWDLETGQELWTLPGHASEVTAVAMSPDGRRAVSASADGTLKIWDLENGEALHTLQDHDSEVLTVAVSFDGQRIASTSRDRKLRVRDLQSGKLIATFTSDSMMFQCAFAPDGHTLVTGEVSGCVHFLRLENID
jgi:WD40 repeat protein